MAGQFGHELYRKIDKTDSIAPRSMGCSDLNQILSIVPLNTAASKTQFRGEVPC